MGIALLLLADKKRGHDPGRVLSHLMMAAFRIRAGFFLFEHRSFIIADPSEWVSVDFTVQKTYGKESPDEVLGSVYSTYRISSQKAHLSSEAISSRYSKGLQWWRRVSLVPDRELYIIAQVHDTKKTRILYELVNAYLELEPAHYIWTEEDWVYTRMDMERMKSLPFDPNWCFKDPRMLI